MTFRSSARSSCSPAASPPKATPSRTGKCCRSARIRLCSRSSARPTAETGGPPSPCRISAAASRSGPGRARGCRPTSSGRKSGKNLSPSPPTTCRLTLTACPTAATPKRPAAAKPGRTSSPRWRSTTSCGPAAISRTSARSACSPAPSPPRAGLWPTDSCWRSPSTPLCSRSSARPTAGTAEPTSPCRISGDAWRSARATGRPPSRLRWGRRSGPKASSSRSARCLATPTACRPATRPDRPAAASRTRTASPRWGSTTRLTPWDSIPRWAAPPAWRTRTSSARSNCSPPTVLSWAPPARTTFRPTANCWRSVGTRPCSRSSARLTAETAEPPSACRISAVGPRSTRDPGRGCRPWTWASSSAAICSATRSTSCPPTRIWRRCSRRPAHTSPRSPAATSSSTRRSSGWTTSSA
ncbi:hypothetical protein LzC2_26570 [Planctomycetes bacterium LzC2]|uniref:Uncharacterized protein n=1 Tax=Alienimonas chondri TaxID=2681879 RepID=A0ABX1VFH7_9PLAN|nr:hypothetical protein [Alienimonas chondri]